MIFRRAIPEELNTYIAGYLGWVPVIEGLMFQVHRHLLRIDPVEDQSTNPYFATLHSASQSLLNPGFK